MNILELEKYAGQIRRDIIRMVYEAQSGHPGGALGCADFFTVLFFEIMQHKPGDFDMNGTDRDIFILSNGHISPVLYSTLARSGYFDKSELSSFRKINSRLQGHPAIARGLEGIHVATGSLGQGLSVALGAAQAKALNNDPNFVFVLSGDGELQEGQIWEAVMYAGFQKINNLILTVDYNQKQIDGDINDVLGLGNLRQKFEAFGWNVLEMDGHNIKIIGETLEKAKKLSIEKKPVAIIMETEMGKGVDYMMGTHEWHGKAPNEALYQKAMAQLPETIGDY